MGCLQDRSNDSISKKYEIQSNYSQIPDGVFLEFDKLILTLNGKAESQE